MASSRKRLVIFVEGKGDKKSAVVLVKRLLAERKDRPFEFLLLDEEPFTVHGVEGLTGRVSKNFTDFLLAAAGSRSNVGAILVILDGDRSVVHLERSETGVIERQTFCAKIVATHLAARAKMAGAGVRFSLSCVFAIKEFESWFLAGVKSLSHARVSGLTAGISSPADMENIRDAKGWLSNNMPTKYKPTTHQLPMAKHVDLSEIRSHNLRSFRRLENAIDELVTACKTGNHIISPL